MFDQIKLIQRNGYNPTHIIDIGAYHGQWTVQTFPIFPDAKFIMIEANDHPELNKYKTFSNISVINEILNDTQTDVIWNQSGNTGDSLHKEQSCWSHMFQEVSRTSITMNHCIQKYNIDLSSMTNIFMKIDCQGAEIAILKGATDLFVQTDFILMELPLFGKYNANVPSFLEHIQYMDSIGFQPYDIVDNHYINHFNMQVDMLFINKNHSFVLDVQYKLLKEFKEGL